MILNKFCAIYAELLNKPQKHLSLLIRNFLYLIAFISQTKNKEKQNESIKLRNGLVHQFHGKPKLDPQYGLITL